MTILYIILLILIILGGLYAIFSLVCVLGFFANPGPCKNHCLNNLKFPGVSILKPLKGLDPWCAENIASFCNQDYPCHEVLFGFRDPDDPAIPIVKAVADLSPCDTHLVVSSLGTGTNQKVLNLKALAEKAYYSMLALSDSDMVVDRYYLKHIVAEFLSNDKTGIVTSLYKISSPTSLGSALESLTIAVDFIPSVLVARRLEGVTFGLGASILISKDALKEIGGFDAIADHLADDYQIGFRLSRKGYKNIISRYVIENRVGPMGITNYLGHQLRWARTYRTSRPLGFLGYGITHIFIFSLLFFCVKPTVASALIIGLVLGLRYLLAIVIYRKVIKTRGWLKSLFLLPFKDIFSFFIWLWSFIGSRVSWRGTSYRVIAGGRMIKV